MGRELRRVPMDFDYPLNKVWYGYLSEYSFSTCFSLDEKRDKCSDCKKFAEIMGIPLTDVGCPDIEAYLAEPMKRIKELLAPPAGEGYQLWSTTTEGHPMSPVFATLEELCAWCEDNATVFADGKISKERWMEYLSERDTQDERNCRR